MDKGIDISSYQGTINWSKVKNDGVKFVIIKGIRKDLNPDKRVFENVLGCIQNGITFSFYNYLYATDITSVQNVAKKLVEIIANLRNNCGLDVKLFDKYFDKYIWLDIEDDCQKNLGHKIVDNCKAYQLIIENSGHEFGVYTGLSFYNTYFSKYASEFDFPFWIARYYQGKKTMYFKTNANSLKKPNIKNGLWGWQYTSSGIVSGISGSVDLDEKYSLKDSNKGGNSMSGVCSFSRAKDGNRYLSNNFKVNEFRCKDGSDNILIDVDFVKDKLQNIRDHFNKPVTINSAYRTDAYNKKVGGASNSYHKKGMAFDIVVKGVTPHEVALYACSIGIKGIIEYNTFVHVDNRESTYWARNNNGKISDLKR